MNKNQEIRIGPKALIGGLLGFIALAVLGFTLLPKIGELFQKPVPALEIIPQAEAAKLGAQVFFSVNAGLGQNAWVGDVCKVSSEEGCEFVSGFYAPMFWKGIEQANLVMECEAQDATYLEGSENGTTEAWRVTLSCTKSNGEAETDDVTVIVENTSEGWKMLRVAFEQETNKEVQQ